MIHPHGPKHHHNIRFYIVSATLIIGGILLLLSLNNSTDDFSLTSAVVGIKGDPLEKLDSLEVEELDRVDIALEKETKTQAKTIGILLTFDNIPKIQKEAKVKEMLLKFEGLTTSTIRVDDDKLELNNLDEVSLSLDEFKGDMEFDSSSLSLNGIANKIEVNGVAFSSEKNIKISFENLEYQHLEIGELELENLRFETGNGDLKVQEKLDYNINQEEVKLYYFKGKVSIYNNFNNTINLEGDAKGISVSGDLLNLNLR